MTKEERQQIRKGLIQEMALKFVEAYKRKMRNEQTTREDDIATAFTFGFSSAIKGAKAIIGEVQKYNRNKRDSELTSEHMKSFYEMFLFQIDEIFEEFDDMDYIQNNEENEKLN